MSFIDLIGNSSVLLFILFRGVPPTPPSASTDARDKKVHNDSISALHSYVDEEISASDHEKSLLLANFPHGSINGKNNISNKWAFIKLMYN